MQDYIPVIISAIAGGGLASLITTVAMLKVTHRKAIAEAAVIEAKILASVKQALQVDIEFLGRRVKELHQENVSLRAELAYVREQYASLLARVPASVLLKEG